MLQTLGSPMDPDSIVPSAGSKSVETCEGMVAVAEEADAEEVEAAAVMAVAEVTEAEAAEVPEAEVAEADVAEAENARKQTHGKHMTYFYTKQFRYVLSTMNPLKAPLDYSKYLHTT